MITGGRQKDKNEDIGESKKYHANLKNGTKYGISPKNMRVEFGGTLWIRHGDATAS